MIHLLSQGLKQLGAAVTGLAAMSLIMGSAVPAHAQKTTKLTVGILPIISQMPYFAAIEKGYFKEAGLDVETRTFPSAAAVLDALNAKAINVAGVVNVGSLLMAQSQGFDLAVFGGMDGISDKTPFFTMVMTRKDSGINEIKDLAGKRVGIVHLKNNSHIYLMEVLARNGVDPKKVTWVEVAIPRAPATLINNQVDATVMIEPFIAVAQQAGDVKPLFSEYVEIAPGGLIAVQVAQRQWAKENAKTLAAYAGAIKKGLDYVLANQDEARSLLVKYARLDENLAKKFIWPVWKLTAEPADLQIGVDLFVKYGVLDKPVPVEPMLVNVQATQ